MQDNMEYTKYYLLKSTENFLKKLKKIVLAINNICNLTSLLYGQNKGKRKVGDR